MTIKKFFVFSVILHVIIYIGIYFIPVEEKKQSKEFFTSLVTPEEVLKPEIKPVPLPPSPRKPIPSLPPQPYRPVPKLTPEKPVTPDFGKETGKPLPEGKYPEQRKEQYEHRESETESTLKPGYSDREKIFDKGVIKDIIKKQSNKDGKEERSITFKTNEYRYVGYMRKFQEKIENIWVYPPEAAAKGIYGDLFIRFSIMKNGKLGKIELERTSGYQMLDDAAIKALKDGEPYWPLPDEWGMESMPIHVQFIYSIYGYYIQ
ncbi:MAG: hypothetical protein A2X59_00245 [Nitrospirae bacterium GWC2_42_7]|nr:MAG: hypothetical protein A2X59_00245 [Nitrospirae bacterium GWC2_42_7]